MDEQKPKRDYLLPISILVGAVLVSGSLIYNAGKKSVSEETLKAQLVEEEQASPVENVRVLQKNDHLFGNPKAPVKIIEFSDLECPFCKRFHNTMKQIITEYDDKVAWVYRHFPLDALHSKARKEAEASECAAELGGNDGFWKYVDALFEITPSNDGLDLNTLPELAVQIGLDRKKFEICLASGKHKERIAYDEQDAQKSGGRGTPYSIVINSKGNKYVIPGALPLNQVKTIIDQAFAEQ